MVMYVNLFKLILEIYYAKHFNFVILGGEY
ncbi:hypothetical protein M2408_000617 [Sphingobacterium sp. BIGb0165]|nr:hypothetical protein [Sphingobacterium sp. BIGb0165]